MTCEAANYKQPHDTTPSTHGHHRETQAMATTAAEEKRIKQLLEQVRRGACVCSV